MCSPSRLLLQRRPAVRRVRDGWLGPRGPGPWTPEPGAVAAGTDGGALTSGHARRIATGARLPAGAERVIRDEEVEASPDLLHEKSFRDSVRNDIRRRGSEWAVGTPGSHINAARACADAH